jgi:rhamnopyranosyl-N-acetylglucosaminyl-diphospho-decaprenol beta-1,3/1,4-galactofuranosyltransferase
VVRDRSRLACDLAIPTTVVNGSCSQASKVSLLSISGVATNGIMNVAMTYPPPNCDQMVRDMDLYGVLVTFDRPKWLARCLSDIFAQTMPLRELIVVDNAPSESSRSVIDEFISRGHAISLVSSDQNLGPAGGLATGLRRVLSMASVDDLVVLFDDDDPLPTADTLASLVTLFKERSGEDPRTGGVGLRGATFCWRSGRARRVEPGAVRGPVRVDHLHGNAAPIYSVGAVRRSGMQSGELFWGLEELDFGLRLTAAGYTLYMDADLWQELRAICQNEEPVAHPSLRLKEPTWRRYYALRNLLYLLIRAGRRPTALRVALVRGLAKPLFNTMITPRLAVSHLRLNVRAIRDAWKGRMGLTVRTSGDKSDPE